MKLTVKKLHPEAVLPSFAHFDDAGLDLYSIDTIKLQPGERTQIKTGVALALPVGYVGLIWDKSGLSHKAGIKTLGGVIDAGYRGEVMVGVVNLGSEPYTFEKGVKIAQMLIQKVEHPELTQVETLDETNRGPQGFGSTGK